MKSLFIVFLMCFTGSTAYADCNGAVNCGSSALSSPWQMWNVVDPALGATHVQLMPSALANVAGAVSTLLLVPVPKEVAHTSIAMSVYLSVGSTGTDCQIMVAVGGSTCQAVASTGNEANMNTFCDSWGKIRIGGLARSQDPLAPLNTGESQTVAMTVPGTPDSGIGAYIAINDDPAMTTETCDKANGVIVSYFGSSVLEDL